jgi:hypothetical protein
LSSWLEKTMDRILAEMPTDPATLFKIAMDDLDRARNRLADAQTEFIKAERRYQEASRAYMADRFSEPPGKN